MIRSHYAIQAFIFLFFIFGCDLKRIDDEEPSVKFQLTLLQNGVAYSIVQNADDSYILGGGTAFTPGASSDLLVVKINAFGNPLLDWENTWSVGDIDVGKSLVLTPNEGFVISGYTYNDVAPLSEYYIAKCNANNGDKITDSKFGGAKNDVANCIKATQSGDFVFCGYTYSTVDGSSDMSLVYTNAAGTQQWAKTFGGAGLETGNFVELIDNNSYVVCGSTTTNTQGSYDVYVIKTDKLGGMVWEKKFGGQNKDEGNCIRKTKDGGFIICGSTKTDASATQVYLLKIDGNGQEQWSKDFGGADDDIGYSVIEDVNGGYVIVGETSSKGAGNTDVYLIKTDPTGNMLWEKTYGTAKYEHAYSIIQTSDKGYAFCGTSGQAGGYKVYFVKTDKNGN